MMKKNSEPCPCGRRSGKQALSYSDCCGRYLENFEQQPAPDAESLMRSRYTAFVLQRKDYLLHTWDTAYRPETLDFEAGVKWLGLDIRVVKESDAHHAEVEFVARSRLAGKGMRLHERSRFVCSGGRWFYLDGDMLD